MGKLIETVNSPADLKRMSVEQLEQLAAELREIIIDVVSRRGGHLASNLGVTELSIALHHVFDFRKDRLLFDVGHQCYAHKLLTGRREMFERLRQSGGLSGFPDPAESEYDLFKVGHAGTAISTAMGLALGDSHLRRDSKVVAVVGDASVVNGLSLEGINNAAMLNRQFLVILNDNSMAIDVTQGALARAMDRIRLTQAYAGFKETADHVLRRLPLGQEIGDALRHLHTGLRSAVHGTQAVEALGFRYFGPVDGHDMRELLAILRRVAKVNAPVLLHVHTQKGRGCDYAVEDPTTFHSPTTWKVESGKVVFAPSRRSWTCAFADAIIAAGERDPRVVAITAAMPDGTGLSAFRNRFPNRYYDVGINESHAVAMAGGLAKSGLRPVVAIYSTFLQRAYDQIFQEVSLQGLPVVFCLDRAGLVGSDGAVHHGFMDLAYLRGLPGMVLMAPADQDELSAAVECALALDAPTAIRYPRDQLPDKLPGPCPAFEPGRARVISEGSDGAFLCYGTTTTQALAAQRLLEQEGLSIGVVSARFAKPLDEACIESLLNSGKAVVTVEEHVRPGGFGSAVLELAVERGWPTQNLRVACLPDRFIPHAGRGEQLAMAGLDAEGLAQAMRNSVAATEREAFESRRK